MDLTGTECEVVKWIQLARSWVQLLSFCE